MFFKTKHSRAGCSGRDALVAGRVSRAAAAFPPSRGESGGEEPGLLSGSDAPRPHRRAVREQANMAPEARARSAEPVERRPVSPAGVSVVSRGAHVAPNPERPPTA